MGRASTDLEGIEEDPVAPVAFHEDTFRPQPAQPLPRKEPR